MKRFRSPVGEYQEKGAVHEDSFYTFYEILMPPAENGIYEIVAWARWNKKNNKGWTQRLPAEYGNGLPISEEGKLAFEMCQEHTPQDYDLDFIVAEDGSGQLKINENVTIEFEAGSFKFSCFVDPIEQNDV